MDTIDHTHPRVESGLSPEKGQHVLELDEDDAVRKVEAATTPDSSAQKGVRNVEAVTLSWNKTSLALAFIWYACN